MGSGRMARWQQLTSVVLPASGCEMMAKLRRLATSLFSSSAVTWPASALDDAGCSLAAAACSNKAMNSVLKPHRGCS